MMHLDFERGSNGRTSLPDPVRLVTATTLKKRDWFDDFWIAREIIRELRHLDRLGHAYTLAYLLMPNRLFWLVRVGGPWPMPDLVQRWQQRLSVSVDHPIFIPGYQDHPVQADHTLAHMALGLVRRPVQERLVTQEADYPFWDHAWINKQLA